MTGRVAGCGVAVVGDKIDSMPRGEDIGLAICGAGAGAGIWAGEAKAGGGSAPGPCCAVLDDRVSFGICCAFWAGCCIGVWSGVEGGCVAGGLASSLAVCVGAATGAAVALGAVAGGPGGGGGAITPFGGPYCMNGRAVLASGGGAGGLASFTPNIVTSNM